MENLTYLVKGSSSEPYAVTISFSPFEVSCTCTAATSNLPCKHRNAIMFGIDPGIVDGDKSKLPSIMETAETGGILDLIKNYESAKAGQKAVLELGEKYFRKYRKERLNVLKGHASTEFAAEKAHAEMEAAIAACLNDEDSVQDALDALRKVYKQPPSRKKTLASPKN